MSAAPDALANRAVSLAASLKSGRGQTQDGAVQELTGAGDRPALELAQQELVRRVQRRSDDYEAIAGLSLVNRALAAVGWADPFSSKHRRKP